MNLKPFVVLVFMLLLVECANATMLSFDSYKKEALGADLEVKKSDYFYQGFSLLEDSHKNITRISLISGLAKLDDKRPTNNPSAQGTKTQVESFNIGLRQLTEYGIDWTVTQNISHTKFFDVSPVMMPRSDYFDFYPKFELRVNLWRNLGGTETKNLIEGQKLQNESQKKGAEIAKVKIESDVLGAYYKLYANHRSVEILQDALARAEKLLVWTQNKASKNLIDPTDLFSARALVGQRKNNLIDAETAFKNQLRIVNIKRGVTDDITVEEIETPPLNLASLKLNRLENKKRKDLIILDFQNETNKAQAIQRSETFKPNLDFSLMALKQGRGKEFGSSVDDYSEKNQNEYILALNFSMPLDIFSQERYRDGFKLLEKGGDILSSINTNDERISWGEFVDYGDSLLQKYQIVSELEEIQAKRADAERVKFNQGRSTTFHVLSYEQDYLATRSQKVTVELLIRQFEEQLKLFE